MRTGGHNLPNEDSLKYMDVPAVDEADALAKRHDLGIERDGTLRADVNFLGEGLNSDLPWTTKVMTAFPLLYHLYTGFDAPARGKRADRVRPLALK